MEITINWLAESVFSWLTSSIQNFNIEFSLRMEIERKLRFLKLTSATGSITIISFISVLYRDFN